MHELVNVASWVLLGGGAVFLFVGGVGLLRLPDFYTRVHAAGLTDTLGAGLVLIGLMTQADGPLIAAKLFLILAFLFFTSPTATHALARAALLNGLQPRLRSGKDGTSRI